MTFEECATAIAAELIKKSGVREWTSEEAQTQISDAAVAIATGIFYEWVEVPMAVTAVFRNQVGTSKVVKNSGGDAAITLASLANAAGRQAVKLDLGATFADLYKVKATFEIAATPTAGNTIDLYWAPSDSGTAGTDNPGNVTGTDAAYAGYSSNLVASLKQLIFIGSFVVTTQATTTVQAAFVGRFSPPSRYGSLVVVNNSGASLHSTETNQAITITPDEGTSEPT